MRVERTMSAEVRLSSGPDKLDSKRSSHVILLEFFFLCFDKLYYLVLSSQQNRAGYKEVPYMLCSAVAGAPIPPPPQVLRASGSLTILSTFCVLVTHHYHQSPEFTLGFTPGVVRSMGFDIRISP